MCPYNFGIYIKKTRIGLKFSFFVLLLLYLDERYQIYSIRYVFFSGKPGKPIAQDRKKTTHLVYSGLKLSPNQ